MTSESLDALSKAVVHLNDMRHADNAVGNNFGLVPDRTDKAITAVMSTMGDALAEKQAGEMMDDIDEFCITRDFEEWAVLPPSAFILDKDGDGEYESHITKRAYQCFEWAYKKGMWGAAHKINNELNDEVVRLRNRELAEVPRADVIETLRKRTGMAQYVLNQFETAGYQIVRKTA